MKGKTALITGSAKGLGKRAAEELARFGCDIVLNYRSSGDDANELANELAKRYGVRSCAIQADVAVPSDTGKLARQALELTGQVDILVNNAGPFIRERRVFAEYEEEEIIALLHGNLLGSMLLDRHLLSGMRERGWGRVIHFGFGHAMEGRAWPHRAVYAAAKTGLVSFTKTLAVEEGQYGITVNMVCPGDIRGDFKEKSIADVRGISDEESPLSRPGTGEDVARVIAFLCLPQSDFLTGNIIDVTGGFDPIRTSIKPSTQG
ncbi:SDR family oxidoreductase [Paenibacillus herberti]|uniref:3-oxoacyl-ACP reductase n=1 Tax=Paenibacillus herberti TaxID=1619309 RepID=A0A229NTN5_9BACL|nr:SDR family oxidoreductase [Paenibacillus herberti]OXM13250.1 3-oxoacyl-ACP reductase [Paenibacillus herberti]